MYRLCHTPTVGGAYLLYLMLLTAHEVTDVTDLSDVGPDHSPIREKELL